MRCINEPNKNVECCRIKFEIQTSKVFDRKMKEIFKPLLNKD